MEEREKLIVTRNENLGSGLEPPTKPEAALRDYQFVKQSLDSGTSLIQNTLGTKIDILISEVSLFQGKNNIKLGPSQVPD